ncbi:MAG: hypothetical protein Q8928_05090 [Bacteroidota bacterium]|nr:hypothetical protein [Bacteroidota bacterium]
MKTNFFIVLIYIGTSAVAARAQNAVEPSERKFYLDFGGAVGVFIPFDQTNDPKTLYGSNAMTYLQLNYQRHLFTKLQFGQTTVNFKSQSVFGTVTSQFNSKANSTNLGLSTGYQQNFGKWQPFILLGAGASFIDIPTTAFDTKANTVSYTTASTTNLYINAGAGVNFKLSKGYIIFLEAQASTIPDLPKSSYTHLSGISVVIGLKAPL